jgi:site-specific recombinase XerD
MEKHRALLMQQSRDANLASSWPSPDELAALRAWFAGLSSKDAVQQYLSQCRAPGQSSRSIVGNIKRRVIALATSKGRTDLVELLTVPAANRAKHAKRIGHLIDEVRSLPAIAPLITDNVARWLTPRIANALLREGIQTLADLTVRVPRRRQWWVVVPGLGPTAAAQVEQFFKSHPDLTERARSLIAQTDANETKPWEQLVVPTDLDGSSGRFRAPRSTCALEANDDYAAIHAWISLQESPATQRAYRKEAERLLLWAILDRGKPLSSLTTEDAIDYRNFLRKPTPATRWIGKPRSRAAPDWKPFQGPLSQKSLGYALSVIGAMYRWLIEQRYVLVNPFAGVKVRGAKNRDSFDASRGFNEHDWSLIRSVATNIEWTGGWSKEAAARLNFILDFWHATGLRPQEFADARLGQIHRDDHGDDWLKVLGKGNKIGNVALPLAATSAVDRYLRSRKLAVTRTRWDPKTPLIPNLVEDGARITRTRIWALMKRFFSFAVTELEEASPAAAAKLRRATPHWLRHTHATHALSRGVELTSVRDNLRHASVATTSAYLHSDDVKRAQQLRKAFG